MKTLNELFQRNQRWAKDVKSSDPDFFIQQAKNQSPEILWIGCSDSRVPPTQIAGLLPGKLFVHRNIANVIVQTDLNSQAVLQYAVEALNVSHIIVCGHYNCGGVQAVIKENAHGMIKDWLRPVEKLAFQNMAHLTTRNSFQDKVNALVELNVAKQVKNICETETVQNAWNSGKKLFIHGWIYDLETGLLKDLGIDVNN